MAPKKGAKKIAKILAKMLVKMLVKICGQNFGRNFGGQFLGEFFVAIRPFPKKNLVGSLLPRRQPVVIAKIKKNVKIGLKRVAVGAFWTSPIPKCTEKQDLQPRYRDIAPKPLK